MLLANKYFHKYITGKSIKTVLTLPWSEVFRDECFDDFLVATFLGEFRVGELFKRLTGVSPRICKF